MKSLFLILTSVVIGFTGSAQQTIDLNTWKFSTGDNPEWAQPAFNDAPWKHIRPGGTWEKQGYAGYNGYAWYRVKFRLPSGMKANAALKDSLRILLGKIDDHEQTFLNGRLLGQNAKPIPPGSTAAVDDLSKTPMAWDLTRDYVVAVSDPRLRWDAENTLAIRVFDEIYDGGLYSLPVNVRLKTIKDYLVLDTSAHPLQVNADGSLSKTIAVSNRLHNKPIKGRLAITITGKNNEAIAGKVFDINLKEESVACTINFKASLVQPLYAAYTFTGPTNQTELSLTGELKRPFTANYSNSLAPLTPSRYIELPLGAIKPAGWLLEQLNIMKDNSTGHLDEYYAKLKDDNGWLGGKGDGWEETPYWLDGAVPLAYLLDDKTLKEKVQKYINWTLDHQRPSGYFGPLTKYERETGKQVEKGEQGDDWWPKMVMLKVMQQYYTATADERVIRFMDSYFRYQFRELSAFPLSAGQQWEWARSRGQENILSVYWLYNITKEKYLLDLGDMLYKQSFPWGDWMAGRDWVIGAAAQQGEKNWMYRHGVNVAMGIKAPILRYQAEASPKYLEAFKTGWTDLMRLHGLPMGMFSADEDLHGNAPTQGTELCAIVETMFSLEKAIAVTGNNTYMEALERMTFNALPTQTTDDYNNKQYYQTANQVRAGRGVYDFTLPQGDLLANVFGARSGYTCCLANMHQGWTKYTTHLWYATPDNGLAALVYGPGTVNAKVGNGVPVTIREETSYPFSSTISFHFQLPYNTTFPLELRIPQWCDRATIKLNGVLLQTENGNQVARLEREWKNGDKLTLELPMQVTTSNWGGNSRAVERGPLVYALKMGEEWEQKEDRGSGSYFEVAPTTPWNYGLTHTLVDDPAKNSQVNEKPVKGSFFWNQANAPLEIRVSARRIPGWKMVNNVPYQPVTSREGLYLGEADDQDETITLIPYGCSKLRIVAFPVIQ